MTVQFSVPAVILLKTVLLLIAVAIFVAVIGPAQVYLALVAFVLDKTILAVPGSVSGVIISRLVIGSIQEAVQVGAQATVLQD